MFPTAGLELCEHAAICQLALAAVEVDEGVISIAGTNLKICTRRNAVANRIHPLTSVSSITANISFLIQSSEGVA